MLNKVNNENRRENIMNMMDSVKDNYKPVSTSHTCIVCNHVIFGADKLNECPGCKNTIGFSTDEVKVTSIGKMIHDEQMGDDAFVFAFEFDYEDSKNVESYFFRTGKEKPFLGVVFFLDATNDVGFGGFSITAVFNGNTEVKVSIEESQLRELTDAVLTKVLGDNPVAKDMSIQLESKKEPTENKEKVAHKGIVDLLEIAEDMYSMVKHLPSAPSKDIWDRVPDYVKEDMARELQFNKKCFIEFINYTKLNVIDKCSLKTKEVIFNIIVNNILAPTWERRTDKESEKYVWFKEESKTNDTLKELKDALKDSNREYVEYKGVDFLNRFDKVDMIAILGKNDKECLWIIKSEGGYQIFDCVDKYEDYKVYNLPGSNTMEFTNLNNLLDIIYKISPESKRLTKAKTTESISADNKADNYPDIDVDFENSEEDKKAIQDFIKEECSDKVASSSSKKTPNHTEGEVINSLAKETLERTEKRVKSKREFRRELLLKQIRELSDEDLLNELRRRMSSR